MENRKKMFQTFCQTYWILNISIPSLIGILCLMVRRCVFPCQSLPPCRTEAGSGHQEVPLVVYSLQRPILGGLEIVRTILESWIHIFLSKDYGQTATSTAAAVLLCTFPDVKWNISWQPAIRNAPTKKQLRRGKHLKTEQICALVGGYPHGFS